MTLIKPTWIAIATTTAMATVVAASLLAGCANAPAERFYTLGAQGPVVPLGQGWQSSAALTLALGRVTLPELVDRPQLVVRTGANRVAILEGQRWAESLKSAIPRVLASNLGAQLGGAQVAVRGDHAGHDANYLVLIDITRLDAALDQAVTLEAVWSVRKPDGAVMQGGKSSLREATQAGGYDALVAAHERALARLAAEIAQGVRKAAQTGGR